MGLDGEKKMSKSVGNFIGVTEPPDSIWGKLRPAKTDEARQRLKDPGNPDICNIFAYHKLVSPQAQLDEITEACTTASMGCIDCKKILFENLMKVLDPIREKRDELAKNPDVVDKVLKEGAERAREIAADTVFEAKRLMGLIPG